MDKIFKHLGDIERKAEKIDKISGKGASSLGMKEMLKLSSKGQSISSCMKKTVKDYENVTPTEAEAQKVITIVTKITTLNEHQMKTVRDDKPAMEKMHVGGLVKKNMVKSEETSKAFWTTLVDKTPEGPLKEEIKALAARVQKAYTETYDLYANATGGEDQDIDAVDDSD
ncbi:hypothetical protein BP6252_01847 [Coleophoma cylindrospora]|uniref:Uncharacterized protein n=1 Tax=Coleophoma cylindrospora TaxID=1849047 RepID=A0A3D8SD38_9HELO|nr:hypothetical protein BP6252_01847 [Coleophoma cylindrospora]